MQKDKKIIINKKKIIVLISLLIILTTRIGCSIFKYNYKYKSFKNKKIEVKVIDVYKEKEDKIEYEVKYNNDLFILSLQNVSNVYKYGDILEVRCSMYDIKTKNNPYEFDYKTYLNSNRYVSVLYGKSEKLKETKKNIITYIHKFREKIGEKIDNNLDSIKANLLKSFLYGDDKYLDEDIKKEFSNIGLGHILCVSGTHIIFLLEAFEYITKSKKNNKIKTVLLSFFYCLSLFKVSLLRAIIMNVLSQSKKYGDVYKRYIISLLVVLIINPYYIFNIGVIFSFLSVLGIMLFNSRFNSLLKLVFKHKFFSYFVNIISTTLSSHVLILPFEIATFGKISLIGILSSILLSGIISLIMKISFVLLFLMFIPFVSNILFNALNILFSILLSLTYYINSINLLNISLPTFTPIMYISYFLFIFLVIFGDKLFIYFWSYKEKIKKIVKIVKNVSVMVVITGIIYIKYFEHYVIFFNVGQGNMALIHSYTKNVIVDIGSTEENVAYNIMSNYLKAKDIHSIDLVLLTHFHTDHMNGLEKLIEDEEINVKRVGFSRPKEECAEYELFKKERVAKMHLNEGDRVSIGKIKIEILSPGKNSMINDEDIANANSTVYNVTTGKKDYLFMGDSTKKTENIIQSKYEEILKKVDVIQVSHHGSNTSSLDLFVSKLNTKAIGIISSKKSVYGHPSKETLETFKKYNIGIKITENEGAIKY